MLDDDADEKHNRQLWCAVIAQAIEDATSTRTSKEALRDKRDACDWLLGMSVNFVQACSLAGLDPEAVRDRVMHMPGVVKMFSKNVSDQSFPSAQEST